MEQKAAPRLLLGERSRQSYLALSRFYWLLPTRIRNYVYLKEGFRRASESGCEGIKLVLNIVKESADVFPPLKSVVGGLVALIDVYERTRSNKSTLQELTERIDRLMGILARRLSGDRETVLQFLCGPFVETLRSQLMRLQRMGRDGILSRIVRGSRIERELNAMCTEIERAIQELQLSLGVTLEKLTREILKESVLQNLPQAKDAAYSAAVAINGARRRPCAPGTRTAIINKIMDWAFDEREEVLPVYWISGLAGQGKTTIGYTICERLEELHEAGATPFVSFFCSRQLDTHIERLLVSTLARGLADRSASYASVLVDALKDDSHLGEQRLSMQMSKLLLRPWVKSAHVREGLRPLIVVVDALDENEAGVEFIELILEASRLGMLKGLRILLTSRPMPQIRHLCKDMDGRAVCNLNDIPRGLARHDILEYLNHELPEHRGKPYLTELARVSDGLFIYAATAVRLVQGSKLGQRRTRNEQKFKIEQIASRTLRKNATPSGILDSLYAEILEDAFEELDPGERERREHILLIAICTSTSLSLPVLGMLADVELELAQTLVETLYAVLYTDKDGNVLWHHASFQDFILAIYRPFLRRAWLRVIRWSWSFLTDEARQTMPLKDRDLKEIFGADLNEIEESAATPKAADRILGLVLHQDSRRAELKMLESKWNEKQKALQTLNQELSAHHNQSYLTELARVSASSGYQHTYTSIAARFVRYKDVKDRSKDEQALLIRQILDRASVLKPDDENYGIHVLDELHKVVFEHILHGLDANEKTTRERALLTVTVCYSNARLTPSLLGKMINVETGRALSLVRTLRSVLYIDQVGKIHWYNDSSRRFILASMARSVSKTKLHVISWCFEALTKQVAGRPPLMGEEDLQKICGIDKFVGIRRADATQELIEKLVDLVLNEESRKTALRASGICLLAEPRSHALKFEEVSLLQESHTADQW